MFCRNNVEFVNDVVWPTLVKLIAYLYARPPFSLAHSSIYHTACNYMQGAIRDDFMPGKIKKTTINSRAVMIKQLTLVLDGGILTNSE